MIGRQKLYTKTFSEVEDTDAIMIGREGVLISELYKAGVPMTDGFVLTTLCFDDFLLYNQLVRQILLILQDVKPFVHASALDAHEKIKKLFNSALIPPEIEESILSNYKHVTEEGSPYVMIEFSNSINSQYIPEEIVDFKYLDIKSGEELLKRIKALWLSVFSTNAIEYRTNGYYKGEITAAAIIKGMNANEITGKAYYSPLITKETDVTEIHAYYGMEDKSHTFLENADIYKIDRKKNQIIEKKIIPQHHMLVRTGSKKEKESTYTEIEISKEWQKRQKINDEKIYAINKALTDIYDLIEMPIEISWCIEAGNWNLIDIHEINENISNNIDLINEKPVKEEEKKKPIPVLQKEIEKMVSELQNKETVNIQKEINQVSKSVGLHFEKPTLSNKDGIVNWSKKYDLKTQTYLDISRLNSGNLNSVDYFDGTYFDGTQTVLNHDYLPEKLFKEDQSQYTAISESYMIDISIAAQNSFPKNMIYQFSNITDNEYRMLGIDKKEDRPTGDERFILNPEGLIAEVHAVSKARNSYHSENVAVSLPNVRGLKNLEDLIKILELQGLKRDLDLKFYAELAVPSFAYEIAEIEGKLIDGLIVNYDMLLKLSVYRDDIRDIDHQILIKLLHNIFKIAKSKSIECGILIYEFDEKLISKIMQLKPDFLIFANIPSEEIIKSIKNSEEID